MRARKLKTIVLVSGVVLVLLFVAAAAILYRGIRQFNTAEQKLREAKTKLDRLYNRDPFPTAANKQQEQENERVLEEAFDNFLADLGQGQAEPEKSRQPSGFMSKFWATRGELVAQAKLSALTIPEQAEKPFMFGFERYSGGNVPNPDDIVRLSQQVAIVTNLYGMILRARVNELVGITRDEFEVAPSPGAAAPPPTSGRRGQPEPARGEPVRQDAAEAGIIKPDALFGRFHFMLDLKASEAAVLDLLNQMARNPLFIVVTSLQLETDQSGIMHAARAVVTDAAAAATPPPKPAEKPREDRIVAGRESPMTVHLGVDVYEFRRKASPP